MVKSIAYNIWSILERKPNIVLNTRGKINADYAMKKECVHCVGAKGCVNSAWIDPKLFRFFV